MWQRCHFGLFFNHWEEKKKKSQAKPQAMVMQWWSNYISSIVGRQKRTENPDQAPPFPVFILMSSLNHFIGVYQYACLSSCDTSSNTGTNNNGEFPSCEPRGVNGRNSKLTLFSFSSAACDATGFRETGVSQFLLLQIYFNSLFYDTGLS